MSLQRGSCAIVGVAESDLGLVAPGMSAVDLMAQGITRALDDCGLRLQDIDGVFGAAVELGMAFLAAETLHFGHGQAADADFGQRFADFVELEGFDDGGDLFHVGRPDCSICCGARDACRTRAR